MTNLQRWLMYLLLFLVSYFSVFFATIKSPSLERLLFPLQMLSYIVVIMFGLFAASTVLYRTFTFNDCPEAAKELHEQIQAARKDLISKGFKFRD